MCVDVDTGKSVMSRAISPRASHEQALKLTTADNTTSKNFPRHAQRQFFTFRGVGASDKTNRRRPSLWCTLDAEILIPTLLQPAIDTPATKAHADDVLVSSIGTPLANR